jgi:hypothetical protein
MTDLEEWILDLALEEVAGGRTPPDVSSGVLAELRRPAPALPNDRWRALIMAAAATLFFGVLWAVVQQHDPEKIRKLIEQLGSKEEIDQEVGVFELKRLGKAAREELEKATIHPNPDVAKQARQLLRRLEALDLLTPKLQEAFPEVEDRLSANEEAWLVVLREAVDRIRLSQAAGKPAALGREDLEVLARPAVRGAVTDLQKQEACTYVFQYQLRSAIPETAKLMKDAAFLKAFSPALRNICTQHLSELWKLENEYARKFGRTPKETGAAFWQALTRCEPPLLDPNSGLLSCPARFLAGAEDGRPGGYWGPRGNVDAVKTGSAVGMCDDPLHGSYALILLKSGDFLLWSRTAPITQDARAALKSAAEK